MSPIGDHPVVHCTCCIHGRYGPISYTTAPSVLEAALAAAQERLSALEAQLLQKTQELEKHRWHKWPEEKPEVTGMVYLVIQPNGHPKTVYYWGGTIGWDFHIGLTHWREIVGPEEGK